MAGIDSLVNSRADMFAANPQGLQQRYAMNQDLLDLLALQKLKKDKEAAQRSLQMQMQPESGTVKDQLEGQMMQATKQEVAASLAPGLQQQGQMMQAQQLQQAMGGGVASQPAPNMVGMARGGIVGYAPGGDVEGEEDPLDYAQVDPQLAGLRSPSLMKSIVELFARKNAEAERYRRTGSTAEPSTYTAEVGPQPNVPKLPEGYRFTPQNAPEAGLPSLVPQRVIDDPENEANVAMATETLPAMQRAQREAPQDPRMSRYEAQLARLEAEETDKLGALIAFLQGAGASGGTNLGATLMGGGSGIQVRDARIRDEMTQTLKNIETLQLQRDELAQQQKQFDVGLASEERRDAATIAQRDREAATNAQATIQKAYYDLQGQLSKEEMEMMSNALEYAREDPVYATTVTQLGRTYKNDPTRLMRETIAKLKELTGGYAGIISGTTGGGAELTQPAE
jgi:hypothetical protein